MKQKAISSAQVKHVASLANLTLTAQEVKKFQKELTKILNYVTRLQKVKTTKLRPTSQVTGLVNVSRPDQKETCLATKQALANAVKKEKNYFVIPSISQQWR